MALRASRVKKSTPETKQLEVFISTLGVDKKADLYRCNNLIYINIDIITPVLGVNIAQFTKHAIQKTHYLIIRKQVYVNKYGLTKLIAESIEPVAFQLQDYIYEVIYKLETEGSVNKNDVVSRNVLAKALEDLSISQTTELVQINTIESLREELKDINGSYSDLNVEFMELNEEKNRLVDQNKDLEAEITDLKKMIETLSRYVKCNSKTISVAAREIIDEYVPEDLSHLEEKDINDLHEKSIRIKNTKKNKTSITKKNRTSTTKTSTDKTSTTRKNKKDKHMYDIIRSARPIFDNIYQWKCVSDEDNHIKKIVIDGVDYRSLKHYSDEFLLEGNDSSHDIIWDTVYLSDPEGIYLTCIIPLLSRADENLIRQIVNIFCH